MEANESYYYIVHQQMFVWWAVLETMMSWTHRSWLCYELVRLPQRKKNSGHKKIQEYNCAKDCNVSTEAISMANPGVCCFQSPS